MRRFYKWRGWESPFNYLNPERETSICHSSMDTILEKIKELTEGIIEDSTLFLVDLKIKPTNNVKVFIDGDNGVSIDVISKINRALYKKLEESALFPNDDFSLEVSSPGVDTPLKLYRQYPKNIGRNVKVTLVDDNVVAGILKDVNEQEILVEKKLTAKQKKAGEEAAVTLPFEQIKSTVIELKF